MNQRGQVAVALTVAFVIVVLAAGWTDQVRGWIDTASGRGGNGNGGE